MLRNALLPICITAALSFGAAVQAETVSVSGSTTVASAVMLPGKAKIEEQAGVTLNIVANGSSNGLADLAAGKTTIGMISSPLATTAGKVNAKSPGAVNVAALSAHEIGEARVAFVVHPSNPVKELSLDQVTGILNGTIKNWSEVGGVDSPIVVVAEVSGGGVRSMVEGELLEKKSISANTRELANAIQVTKVVEQMPPAFGLAPAASAKSSSAVTLKTDRDIVQPLILVTAGSPSPNVQAVIKAAKGIAQQ